MGITRQQALDCFASDDLVGLGMEADAVRRRLHPEGVVSYAVALQVDAAVLLGTGPARGFAQGTIAISSLDTLHAAMGGIVEEAGTAVVLHGIGNTDVPVAALEELLRGMKQRVPQLCVQGLSAGEVLAIAARSGLDVVATLQRLRDAGFDGILSDPVDRPGTVAGPFDCDLPEWLRVHRTAHTLGFRTTAAMTFSQGETLEQRIDTLEALRQLQGETGGFAAVIPLTSQPGFGPGHDPRDEATAVEYLKLLAVARMYLDNVDHLQSSGTTQGLKVLQMGLRFGANDAGSVLWQKNPDRFGGAGSFTTEEELRRVIRDAGFQPAQRNGLYTTVFLG